MSSWRVRGTVQDRARGRLSLDDGMDEVLAEVARTGFALVGGALSGADRRRLLAEADAACDRFLEVPARVNGVVQRAAQLSLRVGDPLCPMVNGLAATLQGLLASSPDLYGLHRFVATEARYMRYRGRAGGLGAHRDGKCYALIVAVYTLSGSAPFTVLADECEREEPAVGMLVKPGDLLLLRAPGFDGEPDGRRRHAVGAPLEGERVSLTLRMTGRHPQRLDGWSPPG